jgi:hypothetical protein
VDANTFTKLAEKVQTNVVCLPETDGNCFWDSRELLTVEFMQQGTTIMSEAL